MILFQTCWLLGNEAIEHLSQHQELSAFVEVMLEVSSSEERLTIVDQKDVVVPPLRHSAEDHIRSLRVEAESLIFGIAECACFAARCIDCSSGWAVADTSAALLWQRVRVCVHRAGSAAAG